MRERARAVSGSHNPLMGGVAIALHERYRTGLVQRSTLNVLAHLAKGSPVEAVNALSLWNGGGRYLGQLLDEALSLSPAAGERALGLNGRAWASLEALRHGQLQQGLSVALSFAQNREVLVKEGSKLVSGQQKASFTTARDAYAAAASSGLADPDAIRAARAEANAARANSGVSRPSYRGGTGGANGTPMLSSAEASRRAAANVCAWSMNNSRFCK